MWRSYSFQSFYELLGFVCDEYSVEHRFKQQSAADQTQLEQFSEVFLYKPDETWIHYYILKTNQQFPEWFLSGSRAKRPKTQKSAGKVLGSILCDSHGNIFINYCALLDRLDAEIRGIFSPFNIFYYSIFYLYHVPRILLPSIQQC